MTQVSPSLTHFGPSQRSVDIGMVAMVAQDEPYRLECGQDICHVPVAFQSWGQLNEAKDNAILICHALTGDQFVIGTHPVTGKPGWWEMMVGPGKIIDTEHYYVICSNVIGSCMGSLSPKSINPETDEPYGLSFPVITLSDMVGIQALLLDQLGIERLFAVVGGSMGGMQVLQWASMYPERLQTAIAIATSARHSAQNIAFHEIGRQAVMADPEWRDGRYLQEGTFPSRGLAVARMTAHVTYVSEDTLTRKFGRQLQDRDAVTFGFDADFQIESYLRYQGKSFVERFDPNSYLYITRAMDYFDLAEAHGGRLSDAFSGARDVRFCIVSFSSDWTYPTAESRAIVHALNAVAANVSFVEVETDKGHDAFLLDEPAFQRTIDGFLQGNWNRLR